MHVGMGVFFQGLGLRSDAQVYTNELALVDRAEGLGFDSVWTAEHHFTDYHMCPNPLQFLTWVAARTEYLQVGSMVMVLPWHDPVRVAEEVCVLDHLSAGRVLLGLGRGLGRVEFEGFGVAMSESRTRFTEYADALLSGLETGTVAYNGSLYQQAPVAIRPAPLATFRGRTYASAVSPESAEIMARLGIGVMVIAQKPWEATIAELDTYREIYRRVNGEEAPKPLLVSYVTTAETESAAAEMFERWTVAYCASTLTHYEFANVALADIPGYEYYGRLAARIAKHGPEEFTRFLAELQTSGTPDQVAEQLLDKARMMDAGGVIAVLSHGGMPWETAAANQQLFANEVLPLLKTRDRLDIVAGSR